MKYFLFVLIGIAGGILGGMGMGGGTLTIPMLTLLMGVPQHAAQGANLIAFIPMSLIALFIHIKNKLVEKSALVPILIPAVFTSVLGAFLSLRTRAENLKTYFGIFLIVLGASHLAARFIKKIKDKKKEKLKKY
ncbi:MAG: sulfite exporter TauE/SafE family protein [Clostridiales bacterium]|jgi:uncharacterized membrane protein YfcA|nr:sulfite exporter TauE/SafE family protein [Clostridiales bacterium]